MESSFDKELNKSGKNGLCECQFSWQSQADTWVPFITVSKLLQQTKANGEKDCWKQQKGREKKTSLTASNTT